MAIIDATQLKIERLRHIENIHFARLSFPSVAGSTTSDIFRCPIAIREGEIKGFRVACDSPDYDIHVYANEDAILHSVDEILRVIDIDRQYQEMNLGIYYSNNDEFSAPAKEQDYLYVVVEEKDGTPTGTVTVEFIVSVADNTGDKLYHNVGVLGNP